MFRRSDKPLANTIAAGLTLLSVTGCSPGAANIAPSSSPGSAPSSGAARIAGITTLSETGSSLLYPLFNSEWIPAYHRILPNVRLNASATGSGTGIAEALNGVVQIGGSDAYLSSAQMQATPHMRNIPLAVSAQQIMYHVPGIAVSEHLRLTGPVLADMFLGYTRYWDDAEIRKVNPGVPLPHQAIVLVNRSDGSGDTFLFSQFLTETSARWAAKGLVGTSISWPSVPGETGAKGNSGVVDTLAATPYSIGYVGISWLDAAAQRGLGYAALLNRSGHYVLPNVQTIAAAAAAGVRHVPLDERESLIFEPGAISYPIINFEYAIVNPAQPPTVVPVLRQFLLWAISPTGGNRPEFMAPVHFLPLPPSIAALSRRQILGMGHG